MIPQPPAAARLPVSRNRLQRAETEKAIVQQQAARREAASRNSHLAFASEVRSPSLYRNRRQAAGHESAVELAARELKEPYRPEVRFEKLRQTAVIEEIDVRRFEQVPRYVTLA